MSGEGVAVVTGAANGIGLAIATILNGQGYRVLAADRDADGLAALLGQNPAVTVLPIDLAESRAASEIRAAAEIVGPLTAWVNNAAIVQLRPLHEASDEHIDELITVNLRAVVTGTREAVRSFLGSGIPGAVINVSSIHAKASFPGYALYDTCKGAVESLTRYVCVEYGHLGIRCNAVAPGVVMTPASIRLSEASEDPEAAFAAARDLSPMHRVSDAHEIADAVAFLLSQQAIAINGHVLAVDNGMAARSNTFDPTPGIEFRVQKTIP